MILRNYAARWIYCKGTSMSPMSYAEAIHLSVYDSLIEDYEAERVERLKEDARRADDEYFTRLQSKSSPAGITLLWPVL